MREELEGADIREWYARAQQMRWERDEAREELGYQHQIALDYLSEREEAWRQEKERARERDEARHLIHKCRTLLLARLNDGEEQMIKDVDLVENCLTLFSVDRLPWLRDTSEE